MTTPNLTWALRAIVFCLSALAMTACERQEQAVTEPAEEAAPIEAAVTAKVPVTTSSEEALALFEEGRALLDDLHFIESRPYFEQAVEKDPNFAMGYVLLANSAQSAAQFFDAVEQAEALAAGASAGEQLIIRALGAGSRNDQAAQLAALNELVSLHPKDERVHVLLGNYYNTQQDFGGATTHYGHAVAINPEFASAYNSLGYAHRSNDDLDSAKEAFAKYTELIPDEANPYDSYAELLMEMGQHDESIENYSKALEIDPNFAASYAGISINQSLKGDSAAAQKAAKDMLAVARTPIEEQGAILQSVTSHLFAGDTEAALAAAEEQYAVAEANGDEAAMGGIREYMGDIMLDAEDGTKALEYFESALSHRQKADINDAAKAQAERTHLFKSSIAAIVSDDVETATALAAEYAAAAEESGTAFERRRIHALSGYLALMNDDNETAVAELAQANQLNPIVLYWSAVANKNVGNKEKAKELAKRAASRNTLSGNLPFVRTEALQLIEELAASQ